MLNSQEEELAALEEVARPPKAVTVRSRLEVRLAPAGAMA
jgi:hypothetical protein